MTMDKVRKAFRFHVLLWTAQFLLLKTNGQGVNAVTSNVESSHFFYQQSEYPRDCQEVYDPCSSSNSTGVFNIKPDGYPEPFGVYCGSSTYSSQWTVILRRYADGTVNFNRTWENYKNGFGFLAHEFWIGNERLSYLTNQKIYQLSIEIILSNGSSINVSYDNFRIGDEFSKYKLIGLGQYSGTTNEITWCPDNMVYGNCSCGQKSCRDPTTCQNECVGGQSDGCICPKGFYMRGEDCVHQRRCGCYMPEEQRVIPEGETFVNDGCTSFAVCSNGHLARNDAYECSPNAVCETRNQKRQCYCNQRFHGDGETCEAQYSDCMDVYNVSRTSGVYAIKPINWPGSPFSVYCNMTDGGGWTVFQRRVDGSVDFYLNWTSYKDGFGNVSHEHWLGNEKLHYLTNQGKYRIRVDLVNRDGAPYYAKLSSFRINNETDNYRLAEVGTSTGTVGGNVTLANTDCVEVASTSFPRLYPSGQNILWNYETDDPSAKMTVRFVFFATEKHYDFVTVGSGSTTLLRASGGKIPHDVSSQGNSLWIRFTTDSSHTNRGFLGVVSVNGTNCQDHFGNAGVEVLIYHHSYQFTTKDRDNDNNGNYNCAIKHHGAWWYHNNCHDSNLNGDYNASSDSLSSIGWKKLPGSDSEGRNIEFSEMKIRPI